MRIISGLFKGKQLIAPKSLPVRPTTDMAKEGLFNILNHQYHFPEISCIDLFSGTGNMSYEFVSRGVKEVTAVDANFHCVKFITKTAKEMEMDITCIKSDVFRYLEKNKQQADLIFADPPYDFPAEKFEEIALLVFAKNKLKEDGLLIIEHAKRMDLSTVENYVSSRTYSNSTFSFFEKQEESKS